MSKIDKEHLINCNENVMGKSIYRVFKIEHLLEWFETGKVAFCNPGKWEDPWEGYLFKKAFHLDQNNLGVLPYLNLFYAQCWSSRNEESDIIWKLYSTDINGVRIKIKVGNFYQKIIVSDEFNMNLHDYHSPELFVGKVKYYNDNTIKKVSKKLKKREFDNKTITQNSDKKLENTTVNILFRKRKAFHHESEIRFVYCTNNLEYNHLHSDIPKLYTFTINPYDIINEIIFDPRMDEKEFQSYREKLHFEYKCSCKIDQSGLYKI